MVARTDIVFMTGITNQEFHIKGVPGTKISEWLKHIQIVNATLLLRPFLTMLILSLKAGGLFAKIKNGHTYQVKEFSCVILY